MRRRRREAPSRPGSLTIQKGGAIYGQGINGLQLIDVLILDLDPKIVFDRDQELGVIKGVDPKIKKGCRMIQFIGPDLGNGPQGQFPQA